LDSHSLAKLNEYYRQVSTVVCKLGNQEGNKVHIKCLQDPDQREQPGLEGSGL